MVTLVIVLMPLVLLVGAFTSTMLARSQRLLAELDEAKALHVAEAAVDEAIYRAETGTLISGTAFERDLGRGLSFRAEPVHLGSDGVDNDDDGEVDEHDEDVFRLVVVGRYRGTSRRLAAYLGPVSWLPALGAAVVVHGPNPELRLEGTPLVSGFDHRLDGSAGEAANDGAGVSIAAPGTVADLLATLDPSEQALITGTPSLDESAPLDVDALVVAVQNSANLVLTNGTYGSYDFGNGALGTANITYRDGSVRLTGNSRGAGILLVTGDLELSGTFRFDGVVIVLGELRAAAGTADIYGSVILAGPSARLRSTGTANIRYSANALTLANQRSGRYVTFNGWQEISRR